MNENQPGENVDLELTEDELKMVLGGMMSVGRSKVCDVGGGCWSDTGF